MSRIMMIAAAAVALASPLSAQGRKSVGIPPGHVPPAGMCRIWVDGVPPGQQAAPIDCATAERSTRPANSRVIYGASKNGSQWERGLVMTKDRDAQGRVIYRDASGRYVTRETTSDGRIVWRDLNGTIVRREGEKARRDDADDRYDGKWERGLVMTKDRDAQGRVIYRDASGRYVTREQTSDGRIVWRDLNGTIVHRGDEKVRRGDDNDDDDDKLSKAEKERRKVEKEHVKAEKERLKAERKAQEKQAKEARKPRR